MLKEINLSDLLRKKRGIHMTKKVVGFNKEMVARLWFLMLCFIRKNDEVS